MVDKAVKTWYDKMYLSSKNKKLYNLFNEFAIYLYVLILSYEHDTK